MRRGFTLRSRMWRNLSKQSIKQMTRVEETYLGEGFTLHSTAINSCCAHRKNTATIG
jgi:hypothetical protein